MKKLFRSVLRSSTIAVAILLAADGLLAEEMKYTPVNPAFGGNPFNGQYLLSNATSQRQYDAPQKKRNPAEEFSNNVQSAIMSKISREIADAMLGEDARESGSFSVGNTTVDFQREGENVVVNISDGSSGGTTTIEMPVPRY